MPRRRHIVIHNSLYPQNVKLHTLRRAPKGGKFAASTGFSGASGAFLVGSAIQPELAPILLPASGISAGIGSILSAFGAGLKKPKKKRRRKRKRRK